MAQKSNQTKTNRRKKYLKVVLVTAAVIVAAAVGYKLWHRIQSAKTAAPAQVKDNQQSDSSKASTSSGGVVDNNAGKTTPPTAPTVNPVAPTGAAITITTPSEGELIADGGGLSGTATAATIQYRFKDSDGLDVATGSLSVSGGKYSGSVMGLSARTATGTLEVYNYNAQGAEENWVKINVRYK